MPPRHQHRTPPAPGAEARLQPIGRAAGGTCRHAWLLSAAGRRVGPPPWGGRVEGQGVAAGQEEDTVVEKRVASGEWGGRSVCVRLCVCRPRYARACGKGPWFWARSHQWRPCGAHYPDDAATAGNGDDEAGKLAIWHTTFRPCQFQMLVALERNLFHSWAISPPLPFSHSSCRPPAAVPQCVICHAARTSQPSASSRGQGTRAGKKGVGGCNSGDGKGWVGWV